ncbi:hypothetical protein AK812_SmicGene13568 [Symbiodinium microadriaticum]|uniref:Uncharacterized protein n=1 Tax=Symbiodinium microadriaticum TaxID=2951 RepID=A0A1Q9E7V2_SYMMI|nr:hypothetical protein AK812_SmicGene13568 [Symbiodinium microadriaticum]
MQSDALRRKTQTMHSATQNGNSGNPSQNPGQVRILKLENTDQNRTIVSAMIDSADIWEPRAQSMLEVSWALWSVLKLFAEISGPLSQRERTSSTMIAPDASTATSKHEDVTPAAPGTCLEPAPCRLEETPRRLAKSPQEPELCRGRSQPLELSSEEDCCVVLFLSFFGKDLKLTRSRTTSILEETAAQLEEAPGSPQLSVDEQDSGKQEGKEDQESGAVDKEATPLSSDAELLPMLSDQEHPQEAVVESATEPEDTAGGALSYAILDRWAPASQQWGGSLSVTNTTGTKYLEAPRVFQVSDGVEQGWGVILVDGQVVNAFKKLSLSGVQADSAGGRAWVFILLFATLVEVHLPKFSDAYRDGLGARLQAGIQPQLHFRGFEVRPLTVDMDDCERFADTHVLKGGRFRAADPSALEKEVVSGSTGDTYFPPRQQVRDRGDVYDLLTRVRKLLQEGAEPVPPHKSAYGLRPTARPWARRCHRPALCGMVVALQEEIWQRTFRQTCLSMNRSLLCLRYIDNRLWISEPAIATRVQLFLNNPFCGGDITLEDERKLGFEMSGKGWAVSWEQLDRDSAAQITADNLREWCHAIGFQLQLRETHANFSWTVARCFPLTPQVIFKGILAPSMPTVCYWVYKKCENCNVWYDLNFYQSTQGSSPQSVIIYILCSFALIFVVAFERAGGPEVKIVVSVTYFQWLLFKYGFQMHEEEVPFAAKLVRSRR